MKPLKLNLIFNTYFNEGCDFLCAKFAWRHFPKCKNARYVKISASKRKIKDGIPVYFKGINMRGLSNWTIREIRQGTSPKNIKGTMFYDTQEYIIKHFFPKFKDNSFHGIKKLYVKVVPIGDE